MNELVGLIIHADPNVTEATLYYIFDAIMNKLGHSDAYNYSKKSHYNFYLRNINQGKSFTKKNPEYI